MSLQAILHLLSFFVDVFKLWEVREEESVRERGWRERGGRERGRDRERRGEDREGGGES